MTIKAILFDVDGVVVRAELFSKQYQKKFGVANEDMLPFFLGEFQECLIGKKDLMTLVTPWLERWKWKVQLMSSYNSGLRQRIILITEFSML